MKSSSDRWIIQTYPPIHFWPRSNPEMERYGQNEDGWFSLKLLGRFNHDFSVENPTVFKTLTGAIKRVVRDLAIGGLNPQWSYRILNLNTGEIIPYDIVTT